MIALSVSSSTTSRGSSPAAATPASTHRSSAGSPRVFAEMLTATYAGPATARRSPASCAGRGSPGPPPSCRAGRQPDVLGDGHEPAGRHRAPVGVGPAGQPLGAEHPAGAQVDHRLVVHVELVAASARRRSLARPNRSSACAAIAESKTRTRLRPASFAAYIAASASRSSAEPVVVVEVTATPTDAESTASPPVDDERLVEDREQPLGHGAGAGLVGVLADHEELVAAEAGHGVARPGRRLEPSAHRLQQRVADGVAAGVVDDLEPVEVDEQHARSPRRRPRARPEVLHQPGAVGQPGEVVGEGRLAQLLLGAAGVGDVGDHRQPAAGGVPLALERHPGDAEDPPPAAGVRPDQLGAVGARARWVGGVGAVGGAAGAVPHLGRRQHRRHRAAEDLGLGQPEDLHEPGVDVDAVAVGGGQPQPLVGVVGDRAVAGLGGLERGLGADPVGDVAQVNTTPPTAVSSRSVAVCSTVCHSPPAPRTRSVEVADPLSATTRANIAAASDASSGWTKSRPRA